MFLKFNLNYLPLLLCKHVLINIGLLSPNCGQKKNYNEYKGIKQ